MRRQARRAGQNLVRMQMAAVERVRRELLGSAASHPYFRDLKRHLRAHHGPVATSEIFEACAMSDLVFVGEFHALPACQRFAADLLEQVARRVPRVALGIEFVHTRQQSVLDRRQAGLLDDDTFLGRIHYRDEWGYPWEGYRAILDRAKTLAVPVHALDTSPRSGFQGIRRRDEHAARRVVDLSVREPGCALVVLFGESHLSRGHVPARVRAKLARLGVRRSAITVFQDPDPVYWSLVASGGTVPDAVRVDAETFAVFHATPLEKYEAYRQVLERFRGEASSDDEADLTPSFYNLVTTLLQWLRIRAERMRVRHKVGWSEDLADTLPEVYSGAEAFAHLAPILAEHRRSALEIGEAREGLVHRGAFYESRSNVMFLSRYVPGHAAGEAARYLRAALTGRLYDPPEDAWADPVARAYGAAYNEALAFLGSRLVDPSVDSMTAPEKEALAEAGDPRVPSTGVIDRIHWLEAHRTFERSGSSTAPESLLVPLRGSRPLRRALVRDLGHRLGRILFERVRSGTLDALGLRGLFARPLEANRAPRQVLRLLRGSALGDEPVADQGRA